jgi:dienelactone hydrolase
MKLSARAALAVILLCTGGSSANPADTAGALVDHLKAGRLAEADAMFSGQVRAALGPAGSRQIAGAIADCAPGTPDPPKAMGELLIVSVPLDCGGQWMNADVTIDKAGKVAGFFLSVRQSPPSDARAGEVELSIGDPSHPLPGILTLPPGDGRVPAVVLLGGSGPTDRDSTVGANKPFRDLADGLAARGIAVVRFDKRTRAQPGTFGMQSTLDDEYVHDALDAAAQLRAHARIDPARVFVLGHSLGGTALPRIGARDRELAGLIFVAAPARPIPEMMIEQTRYIMAQQGISESGVAEAVAGLEAAARAIAELDPANPAPGMFLGAPAAYWLDLRANDALAATAKLPHPLLFIQGGRDYQVTTTDAKLWKDAMDAAGKAATWKFHPDVNHLLIAGSGPSTPAEYQVAGKVHDGVIDDIAAFIQSPPSP